MEDVFLDPSSVLYIHNREVTYAAHPYAMLIQSRPLYHVCFQRVVNLWYELEGQCLYRISVSRFTGSEHRRYTFNTVVGGMQ